jgi:hypothetical protein
MATEVQHLTQDSSLPDQYRPALPDQGVGRYLRAVAGVREPLMDWVPEERARYSRLGAIIINTGIMAGVSLFVALHSIAPALPLLLAAAFWAAVIITLDGWLISSTHGVTERRRRMLATRLVVSVIMGAFIAEPLLLWFFGPAIKGEIVRMRQDDANAERSKWVRCNPADVTVRVSGDCGNYVLNLEASPRAVAKQMDDARKEQARLKGDIGKINARIAQMEKEARRECNGKKGDGLSGIRGEGPNCRQARRDTAAYRRDSKLAQKQRDLIATGTRITQLGQQLRNGQQGFEREIKSEIDERMRQWQAGMSDKGILDQERALGRLADRSFFVRLQEWLLRILLITVDILPVLTKVLSRETAYDDIHRSQTNAGRNLLEAYLAQRVKGDLARRDVAGRRTDHWRETQMDAVADATRSARINRQTDRAQEVERLAARLRDRDRPN